MVALVWVRALSIASSSVSEARRLGEGVPPEYPPILDHRRAAMAQSTRVSCAGVSPLCLMHLWCLRMKSQGSRLTSEPHVGVARGDG